MKQGCVLAPTLFGIYFSVILRDAKQNANHANPGVGLRTRFDAKVFSTPRLKAKTKTTTLHVCEILYADNAAFSSQFEKQLQSIIESFFQYFSVKKTVIMSHGTQVAKLTLNDEALETVENFSYLGSS